MGLGKELEAGDVLKLLALLLGCIPSTKFIRPGGTQVGLEGRSRRIRRSGASLTT